jgi:copper chaperone CopZ
MPESPNKQGNVVFKISGMSCNHCVQHIEKALLQTKGVISARVDLALEKACIDFDPSVTNIETLLQVIKDSGYEGVLSG